MRTGLAVSTETSDEGKIKGELVLEPVDSISRTASKDTDQIVAGEVASLYIYCQTSLSGDEDDENIQISWYQRRRSQRNQGC